MDTLTNLRTFFTVAKAGSFAAASRQLGVALSVVKKRVDQLEARLGVRLFERSTRRMVLTEAGGRHLSRLQAAVGDLDEALAGVSHRPARLEGHLRVKVPTTLNALYFGAMLVDFQQCHPHLSMEVVVVDRLVNPQLEGFDVAIGATPGAFGDVVEIGLAPLQRVLAAAPDYLQARGRPISPRDLLRHDILSFQPTGHEWSFESPRGPVAVKLEPRLSSNDAQLLLRAALQGQGVTWLSAYLLAPHIRSGALVALLEDWSAPEFWVHLLVPESKVHTARVQALVEYLRCRFMPQPPWEAAAEAGEAVSA